MKTIVNDLLAVMVRHWLRIGVLLVLLFVISKKQIDLNIQFGRPVVPVQRQDSPLLPPPAGDKSTEREEPTVFTEAESAEKSWLQKMNILGGGGEYDDLSLELRQTDDRTIRAFLDRFAEVARTEQQKFGVPASIILANAMLHGRAGAGPVFQKSNNLFRLGCTSDWVGPTSSVAGSCYRQYENAWTSFRDHSLYVTTGSYAVLTQLSSQDYHAWAKGLEALGFNGTEELARQLEQIIEQWHLYRFD